MGVLRFLFWLVVVVFVARIVWRLFHPTPVPGGRVHSQHDAKAENLLRCSRCGMLISQGLAVLHEGQSYCGPGCRDNTAAGPS